MPLTIAEKSGERREKAAISVDIGKKRIKLWGRGSISGPNCDKITYYHPLTLPGGLRLPITLVRETVTVYVLMQAECLEQIGLPVQVQAEKSN